MAARLRLRPAHLRPLRLPQLLRCLRPRAAPPLLTRLCGHVLRGARPGQAPFVLPGDRVSKGQTVCLIEAMKMMSEVPAPCDCVIESVCKSNGELVAFGEPLFRYRPC